MTAEALGRGADTSGHFPRYSATAVIFHWIIAAAIVGNLVLGASMESLPLSVRLTMVRLHISIGAAVFALAGIRLAWRLTHRPPALQAQLAPAERLLARAVHAGLYVMMFVQPLLGWMLISANKMSLTAHATIFGLIPLPLPAAITHLPQPLKENLHTQLVEAHAAGAWTTLALLVLHLGGVAKHELVDKYPQLRRMTFGRRTTAPIS